MSSWGSRDSQVHFANGLGRKVYVLVTPNPDWAWADVAGVAVQIAATAAFTAASGGTGAPVAAAKLAAAGTQLSTVAKTIQSAKQLVEVIKAFKALKAAKAAYDAYAVISKIKLVAEATAATALAADADKVVRELVTPIKALSQEISANACRLVNKSDYLHVWNSVNPSYWGAIAGADTVQITVFDESLEMVTSYTTGADHSWIATNDAVVRARYGTLWQPDPGAGRIDWNTNDQINVPMIYEHAGFAGASQALPAGRYPMHRISIGNDRLSSLRVPPGWTVTLYRDDNYGGPNLIVTGDLTYVGDAYNDWTSSIEVQGPSLAGVAIYPDADFRGREQVLAPGKYDLADLQIGNDRLSSLRVPSGWSVTLYRDAGFSGPSMTFTSDTNYVGDAYNDWASSIIVQSATVSGVSIYKDANYQGHSQVLAVGRYNISQIAIGNDALSSIRIPPGLNVTLWEHSDFRGNSVTFSSDTPYVGNAYNDWTSSIEVWNGNVAQPPVSTPVSTPVKPCVVFKDANFSGASHELLVGNYDHYQLGVGNDTVSSLRVAPGYRVTLYEHGGFSGATRVFTGDSSYIGDFNDKVSSVRVEKI